MIRVAVNGANGRMGQALIQALNSSKEAHLVGAFVRESNSLAGARVVDLIPGTSEEVRFSAMSQADYLEIDVLIDFTQPESLLNSLDFAKSKGCALVIGTTGLDEEQQAMISLVANQVPVVFSANMSVGVNVALKLVELAAQALANDYDIEVVEAHHRHKKDAPSGTALAFGNVLAQATGRDLKDVAVYGREGFTEERDRETIGFATVRGGDVVGDHTVMYLGDGDRLEITHKASSRATFANGAVRAAIWLSDMPAGLYDMRHVLDLEK